MKKQNIKAACILFSLILFLQANSLFFSAQTQGESLYKRLGGVYSIAAVIDDFVDRLLFDSVIAENKSVVAAMEKITKPGLKYQLTELVCQASGGPQKYNGRPMKEAHQGLNISEAQWQAMVKDFLATLAKFNITGQNQNELLVIVGSAKNDIVVSPPTAPLPSQPSVPTAPALPNPAPAPSQAPAVPTPPNPVPAPSPQVPAVPTLPAQAPAQPSNPPGVPQPAKTLPESPPAPVIDSVQPKLEIPSNPNPPADIIPQVPPQAETPADSAVPQDTQAVPADLQPPPPPNVQDELPPEPTLEPAE